MFTYCKLMQLHDPKWLKNECHILALVSVDTAYHCQEYVDIWWKFTERFLIRTQQNCKPISHLSFESTMSFLWARAQMFGLDATAIMFGQPIKHSCCKGIYRIIRVSWVADPIFVVGNNTKRVRCGRQQVLVRYCELLQQAIIGSCHRLPPDVIWNTSEKTKVCNVAIHKLSCKNSKLL
jgi:hypothetical protein